ncbi:2692_t:CDS:1 [Funneliformis geosporum]|uniref:8552_t:CDS:1 n=1 Tax=Funneliformis geosporum TaxID=1117311 RepID=A0A9W4T720_9GLOM|nr:2692_t:CDS:1 [Funneliformis geosporum]CAI2194427.1 8552_t:CDS:1 [Funneliformis geosporum]
MQDQYHHYIPRFLLRNFAVNNYERIFVDNERLFKQKKHKRNFRNRNNKDALLQTYDRNLSQLGFSLIAKTYGYANMYKDIDHEDAMNVEKKLSKLEEQASKVIRDIIKTSQVESQIVLLRKDLGNLRKFLFIMNYRNRSRWSQFAENRFDNLTWSMVENFMQQQKLKIAQEVWLQNIREILETPHEDVQNNLQIFSLDRTDYQLRMVDCFLVIWQAGENDEFIITSNGFGIFEGVNGSVMLSQFQFAYHWFYVISPKLALVLCHSSFRKEIGPDLLQKQFGFTRSIFEYVPHPPAIPKYVATPKEVPINEYGRSNDTNPFTAFDSHLKSIGLEKRVDDTFTFNFVKVSSATVHLVNSFLLNETKEDLVLTFLSHSYLYKTITKYYKHHKELGVVDQDFSVLKRKLFMVLNQTHEENLNLRRNIPAERSCNWNVRVLTSEL